MRTGWIRFFVAVALLGGGVLLGRWMSREAAPPDVDYLVHTAVGREVSRLIAQRDGQGTVQEIAQKLRPAVVSIYGRGARLESTGTGVVVRSDGHILTNHHVVAGVTPITVQISSGEIYTATLVGADEPTDLALIRIECPEVLAAVEWGDSEVLTIGEEVLAIGNAFGLGWSVTHGIISSLHRSARGQQRGQYSDFIQTDAAINPGNSGGPLVDMNGRVVGINSLLVSGQGNGIGMALPSCDARFVAEELLGDGKVDRGFIGIDGSGLNRMSREQRAALKLSTALGVHVDWVDPVGAAQAAGVRKGDVIISMDGQRVEGIATLKAKVARTPVGSAVEFGVLREGAELHLKVTLSSKRETAH